MNYKCDCGFETDNPKSYAGHCSSCNDKRSGLKFICRCGREFDSKLSLSMHSYRCEVHINNLHSINTINISKSTELTKYYSYICFCGDKFNDKQIFASHCNRCNLRRLILNKSPYRSPFLERAYIPYNKGLTKYNCDSIKLGNDKRLITFERKFGTRAVSLSYWYRTKWNNDLINYPQYYLSNEDIENHNKKVYERLHKLGLIQMEYIFNLGRWNPNKSDPENLLGELLNKLNIEYISQYRVNNRRLDYYLPKFNLALECDGMFKWIITNNHLVLKEDYLNRKIEVGSLGIK